MKKLEYEEFGHRSVIAEKINELIDKVDQLEKEVQILRKRPSNPLIGGPNGRFRPKGLPCVVCNKLTLHTTKFGMPACPDCSINKA